MKETLDAYQKQLKINNVVNASTGALTVGAIVGVGYLGFLGVGAIAKALGYAGDVVEKVQDAASEVLFGKESYSNVDGTEIKNPAHNIIGVGGLFGLGIDIGRRYMNPIDAVKDFELGELFSNPFEMFED